MKPIRTESAEVSEALADTPLECQMCDTVVEQQGDLCEPCAQYCEDVENDLFDDDERDEENSFDCRMMPDGTCLLAGTEDCDLDCPNGGPVHPDSGGV